MSEVIDFAWARPSPTVIKARGYAGVLRYLSSDLSKAISAPEYTSYVKVGLSVGLVWENSATAPNAGAQQGILDGTRATSQARQVGYPAGAVIYAAVDFDVTYMASVLAYLLAFQSHLGGYYTAGAYGSYATVEAAARAGIPWRWQTKAWSGGKVSSHAHLLQLIDSHPPIADTDRNTVLSKDWGQAPRPVTPPPPKPKPTPAPVPLVTKESKMLVQIKGFREVYLVGFQPAAVHVRNTHELSLFAGALPPIQMLETQEQFIYYFGALPNTPTPI